MGKVAYQPVKGANQVSVACAASDTLVVATPEKPFETSDPMLQAELDQVEQLERVTKDKGD